MSDAWYIPEKLTQDQREENRFSPNRPGNYEKLAEVGVFYRHYNPNEISDDADKFIRPFLETIHYEHYDICELSEPVLGKEKFADLAKQHFVEHLHEDDEVRLLLAGSGYFDIRDKEDKWVRVFVRAGDAVVVPAGIYHRFTTTAAKFTKTVRIFRTNPKWMAQERGPAAEATAARKNFLATIHAPIETVAGPALGFENNVFAFRFPDTLDAEVAPVIKTFIEKQHAAGTSDKAVVLFFISGSKDPYTGKSWCPPCAASKDILKDAVSALRKKHGEASTLYIELPVERAGYLGNPNYLYRKHPLLQVPSVPTVLVLTLTNNANAKKNEKDVAWYDLVDVKVRTQKPELELLTSV